MSVCVFCGPTLAPRDGAKLLEAAWLPPARHGDVYRAVSLARPRAIGIVDGYFQWAPSVWHKEILWAMSQGVHVFGAGSMGALRAAELAPLGMRGVGVVFEAYRDGVLADCGTEPFEDDDEVAVVHGPSATGYIAVSEAMVNIRRTLAAAERAGVIDGATRAGLAAIAKALYFPQRAYEAVLDRARAAGLAEAQLSAFRAWLPAGRVDQKRADAVAMLETMRDFLAAGAGRMRAGFSFEETTLWAKAVKALQPAFTHGEDEARALAELRVNAPRFEALRGEVLRSLLAVDTGARQEDAPRPSAQTGAGTIEEGAAWLAELARASGLRQARDEIPLALIERQMLARLRASGEYDVLLARARDKGRRLSARTDLPPVHDFTGVQLLQLRDWYFSRLAGSDMPDDLEGHLRDAGYADETSFHEAIFAEFVYREMTGDAGSAGDPPALGAGG